MAQCVIDEYNQFCPLDYPYQPNCVNGDHTQGENIADNGGIRAAFRAYRNSLGLKGPDPSLPGALSSQFTHDQLFFLNFAQVWCEPPPKPGNTFAQLLLDPHSPSNYRVWGLHPNRHCNVWVDEVKAVTGVPATTTTLPPLNIPQVQKSVNKKYAEAASYFANNQVSLQHHPNGEHNEEQSGAVQRSQKAERKPKNENTFFIAKNYQPVQQLFDRFAAMEYLCQFVNRKFCARIPCIHWTSFPLINKQNKYHWPKNDVLGFALGYLRGLLGMDVLLNTFVDTTWASPQSKKPYSVYLDQPSLIMPREYYIGNAWKRIKNYYILDVANILQTYSISLGGAQPSFKELVQIAASVADFEQTLAMEFMSDGTSRRDYSRLYNPVDFYDLMEQTKFANLEYYFLYSMLLADSRQAAIRLFMSPNEKVIVMEPTKLKKFERAFTEHNKYKFTAKQLYNYLYVRILHNFYGVSDSLGMRRVNSLIPLKTFVRPAVGRPRWEERLPIHTFFLDQKTQPKSFEDLESMTNSSNLPNHQQLHLNPLYTEMTCASFVMFSVPYTTTRYYLDQFYPSKQSRAQFRKGIGSVVEGVLDGFGSMINQLNWMSATTKKGAQDKILNLARNLGWPDFLTNDTALDAYYTDLRVSPVNFGENLMNLRHFDLKLQWNYLNVIGGTQREDFNGPPGIVNAWYQPELNSITLPLGILQQPFYEADWPASVNFGAMGVVIGHELTHGFDDQGVQFDGVGTMRRWMDDPSLASFTKMAQCVIDEYSGMCPLNENQYQPNCINGVQTQGENIADNGGIRAAFRAYRNAISFKGKIWLCQTIFFGQVWCEAEFNPMSTYIRLLVDPHSPHENRVWGTLQNFPAFKNAFNCPANSVYAPENHCNVWASEPKQVNSLPATTTVLPNLNVPKKSQSVDNTQSPCDNFYEYACNNYPEYNQMDTFTTIDYKNIGELAKAFRLDDGEEIIPLEQAKLLFRQCEYMGRNSQIILKRVDLPRKKYLQFQRGADVPHPAFNHDAPTDWMDAKKLAKTLGVLDGQLHTSTLVSSFVMTNAKDPGGEQPYALYVDQSFLSLPDFVFHDFMWYRIVDRIGFIAQIVMQIYADYLKVGYDYNDVDNAAQDIVDFEYAIANNFMTDDNTRRYFDRNYNWMSAKEATKKFTFFDFQTYFNQLSFDAEPAVRQKMQKEDFNFVLMEPDQLAKLGAAMSDGNEFGFTPNQLLNYLYFRVMRDNINNIPYPEDQVKVVSDNVLGYKLYHPNLGRPKYLEVDKYKKEDDPVTNEELSCAIQVYLDHAFPTEKRARVRQGAQIVLNSILLGFRSMVEQISWMSPLAKQGAFDKMDNIVTNVGYPDFITNNTQLENYYKDLQFNRRDNFVTSMEKITKFFFKQQFAYLVKKGVMRDEFGSSNVLVNAWYQPQVNRVVVGHELTHGFDDQGVQWDGVGALNTWLDASSRQAFDQMANCIVQEYNGFCPLDPDEYQPNCLNGFNTQGENIADNGGIHAAFRAYRNSLEVHGPDRALPSDLIGQFTHDQLFFLSFAQPWCMEQQEPEDTYSQILFDPHSPAKYRILGTLRNFPAFRDAFNCPVNAVYAPENHCEVWITDISTKPLPGLPANQINVAVPKTVKADDQEFSTYRNAFNYFKASVNFSYNPCENFYEYACGSYKNKVSFTVARDDNYRKIANVLESLENHPSTAVQKLKTFYDLCTITFSDLYSDNNNGADYLKNIILAKVQKFSEASQLQMTIFDKSRPANTPVPTPDIFATALAYLSIKEGIDTLVTPFGMLNW
uniref:Uncharacterized protein n=1 Tax=Ditylenchus dipsaci TaxID=166011 RepID=A0A915EQK0_9BILA